MSDYSINIPNEAYQNNRALKYQRQKISQALSVKYTGHKVAFCMHTATGDIKVKFSKEKQRAFYSGLMTCGSVWDCPICSAKISAQRSVEISQGVNEWISRGGSVCMVTYTIRHNKSDRIQDVAKVLTDGIRFVHSGAPWQRTKNKYAIKGSITATEVLYNLVNGWHVHKHQLLFLDKQEINTQKLQGWLYERYEQFLEGQGWESAEGIGVVVSDPVKDPGQLSEYISKWGIESEMTAIDKKESQGLTPFELLDDPELHLAYVEYSRAMYGKRRLVWSRGLRAFLGLAEEKPDEVVAMEEDLKEIDTEVIREISLEEWRYIRSKNLRVTVLEKAEQGQEKFSAWYLTRIIQPVLSGLDPGS